MCIWSTIIYQYICKMLLTYQCFSFESVHIEAMLKIGWVVQKWNFSFWTAINWSKCILMISLYSWLSLYTNNEILCIIWKFDLSSRGVLGRTYALSIEVLFLLSIIGRFKEKFHVCFTHISQTSLCIILQWSETKLVSNSMSINLSQINAYNVDIHV